MLTNVDLGKVVLFLPTPDQHACAERRAKRQNLRVCVAGSQDDLHGLLGGPGQGVLVLCSFAPAARAMARAVRAARGWKQLPVFAVVPDELIDARALKQANAQRIELLPTSLPEERRWGKLCQALEAARAGKRWVVCNRRAHFRLPLTAKATLLADAETVDISEGGVAFETDWHYSIGDAGRIDVRSLLGDLEEDERGFPFEVVTVKALRHGSRRYLVGARFVNMADGARQRLKEALELVEPTESTDSIVPL